MKERINEHDMTKRMMDIMRGGYKPLLKEEGPVTGTAPSLTAPQEGEPEEPKDVITPVAGDAVFNDELKKLQFVLPPLNEQNEIVNYLDNATCKIDILISKAQKAIELLKERRTALISAVVTGKIDVRECAGDNSNCTEIPNSSNQR